MVTCVQFLGHMCSFLCPRVFVFVATCDRFQNNPFLYFYITFAKLLINPMATSVPFYGHVCSVSGPRVLVFMSTCVRFRGHVRSVPKEPVFIFLYNFCEALDKFDGHVWSFS